MMENKEDQDEGSSRDVFSCATMMRPVHDRKWWQDLKAENVRLFVLGLFGGAIVGIGFGILGTLALVWAGQYRYEVNGGDDFVYVLDRKTGRINLRRGRDGHLWFSVGFADYDRSPFDRSPGGNLRK